MEVNVVQSHQELIVESVKSAMAVLDDFIEWCASRKIREGDDLSSRLAEVNQIKVAGGDLVPFGTSYDYTSFIMGGDQSLVTIPNTMKSLLERTSIPLIVPYSRKHHAELQWASVGHYKRLMEEAITAATRKMEDEVWDLGADYAREVEATTQEVIRLYLEEMGDGDSIPQNEYNKYLDIYRLAKKKPDQILSRRESYVVIVGTRESPEIFRYPSAWVGESPDVIQEILHLHVKYCCILGRVDANVHFPVSLSDAEGRIDNLLFRGRSFHPTAKKIRLPNDGGIVISVKDRVALAKTSDEASAILMGQITSDLRKVMRSPPVRHLRDEVNTLLREVLAVSHRSGLRALLADLQENGTSGYDADTYQIVMKMAKTM